MVVGGEVLTPPEDSDSSPASPETSCWSGQPRPGLRSREALPLDILRTADEVFITSSTKDVLPVHAVDDRTLPVGPSQPSSATCSDRAEQNLDP